MAEFILSTIFILLFLSKKVFFFLLENQYSSTFLGQLDISSLLSLFILGIYAFLRKIRRNSLEKASKHKQKPDLISALLINATLVVIGLTFYINLNKVSLHWDAIALYDARAKFLEGGMKFSEMTSLAKYDNLNKYYYLLYPPFTSIGHFFWRSGSFLTSIPVGVYYSIFLLALCSLILFIARKEVGLKAASFLVLLIASNGSILNISIKEYTNLPFAFYIVTGTFLLYRYIRRREMWTLLFGAFFISASIWIRLLEPIWIAVAVALGITLYSKKKTIKSLILPAVLVTVSLIQYLSWSYFTKVIAGNPGFLNFSTIKVFEPFVAFFTGAPVIVITTVAGKWGVPFFVHFLALSALALRWKYVLKRKEVLFLGLVVFLSILIYFLEFYFLSFQYDWWNIVAKSLDRSSTFLIPISGYLLVWLIVNSKVFLRKR